MAVLQQPVQVFCQHWGNIGLGPKGATNQHILIPLPYRQRAGQKHFKMNYSSVLHLNSGELWFHLTWVRINQDIKSCSLKWHGAFYHFWIPMPRSTAQIHQASLVNEVFLRNGQLWSPYSHYSTPKGLCNKKGKIKNSNSWLVGKINILLAYQTLLKRNQPLCVFQNTLGNLRQAFSPHNNRVIALLVIDYVFSTIVKFLLPEKQNEGIPVVFR